MAIKLHDSFAIHPGPWLLEEIVKPYNMNVSSTADHLKVTRPALSCQTAFKRDPRSASKRDPLFG